MHRNKQCHLQHFSCCLTRKINGELRLKLSFCVIISHKKTTSWTSSRIVIVKRKYIFEVETPPHHAICPLMQYFKLMEAELKQPVLFKRNGTIFRFRVIY